MLTRGSQVMVVSLLTLAAVFAGCAKRPATSTAAQVPAPTAAALSVPANPSPTTTPPATTATPTPGGGTETTQSPPSAPGTAVQTPDQRPPIKDFVSIPELRDIFFDFDKYDIRPEDAKTLDANSGWMKSNPNHLILIEGHCDERGTNEYNLALGERRAKATMNYLVSQGVQASRITIISYGEERPVCMEHNEACWAKNRRSHFLVKPR